MVKEPECERGFFMEKENSVSQSTPLYTIGELAKAYGIHPQTLRYFDKQDLINPVRAGDGERRKYSFYELYRIALRKQYKNMGISVKETQNIFHNYSLEKYAAAIAECERKNEEQRLKLEIERRGIERIKAGMDKIPLCLGRCVFDTRPGMWRVPHIVDRKFVQTPNSIAARKILLDSAPLSYYSFVLDAENQEDDSLYYKWDVAATESDAALIGLDKIPCAIFVPPEICMYTIFTIKGTDAINISNLMPALDFMRIIGERPCGKIYGNVLLEFTEEGGETMRYFEAWIPIKN